MEGLPMIITENLVTKMLCLPQIKITKPLVMRSTKVVNLYIQMVTFNTIMQKEG